VLWLPRTTACGSSSSSSSSSSRGCTGTINQISSATQTCESGFQLCDCCEGSNCEVCSVHAACNTSSMCQHTRHFTPHLPPHLRFNNDRALSHIGMNAIGRRHCCCCWWWSLLPPSLLPLSLASRRCRLEPSSVLTLSIIQCTSSADSTCWRGARARGFNPPTSCHSQAATLTMPTTRTS
jgi:hypothetical protein